jgi:hypothetical protein
MDDEPPKNEKLRLVADNDPARISERQKQAAADRMRDLAADSLSELVANFLRVLAGAGRPFALPRDLLTAAEHYHQAYEAGIRSHLPGLEDLMLDHLFRHERGRPQTEEEWRNWAADDPERDYNDLRRTLLQRLRRHVLREIASTITGSDLQIRREQQEIEDVLRQIEEARERYFNRPRPPNHYRRSIADLQITKLKEAKNEPRRSYRQRTAGTGNERSNPHSRQETANRKIENLRVQKQDEMIARLQRHQWIALYAVHSGEVRAFDATDSFTFDVLARKKLLERKPGRGKTKRDWQLTELGALAMSRAPTSILDSSQ